MNLSIFEARNQTQQSIHHRLNTELETLLSSKSEAEQLETLRQQYLTKVADLQIELRSHIADKRRGLAKTQYFNLGSFALGLAISAIGVYFTLSAHLLIY